MADESFVKISLGNYQGTFPELKKLLIQSVLIKDKQKFKFVYRHKTKDITKIIDLSEGFKKINDYLIEDFHIGTLFTVAYDYIFENIHNKKIALRKTAPSHTNPSTRSHDDLKKRHIPGDAPYLRLLGISDKHGKVYKATQNKFKQINHYIATLESTVRTYSRDKTIHVADMGSGKGYLSFALYDYLRHTLELEVEMTGIDIRKDLVEKCNQVARSCGYHKLQFKVGQISEWTASELDLLVALHACDTATDEAIFIGIQSGASTIVVAPCCHKQIRKEMTSNRVSHDLVHLTRHGLFLERQAEMVTDSIRTMVLEYFGYKTKVVEFVSDEHTAKNVMLIAAKSGGHIPKSTILTKIKSAMEYFGIDHHRLVDLFEL